MKIKNYDQFLLESIVYSSPDFINILELMRGDEDGIADKLLKLLDQDIKTNYNFIKVSDEAGKLLFVPDTHATKKLSLGKTEEEIFSGANSPTTASRLVRSIFNSNSISVSDASLEAFGNRFKSLMELKINPDIGVSVVKGEDIKEWYLGDNYAGKARGQGPLNKSCMRYKDCQEFFDIYTENTDVVSMVVKIDQDNKLEARALLWKTEQGLYLDRVYYTKEIYKNLIIDWTTVNFGKILTWESNRNNRIAVRLKPHQMYGYFPFLDSLCYYQRDTNDYISAATLTNYMPKNDSEEGFDKIWYCQDTDGGYERQDLIYSQFYDMDITRGDAVFSDRYDSYLIRNRATYSDNYQDFLPNEVAVWSEKINSHLDREDCYQVIVDKEGNKDWYPKDDKSLKTFVEQISKDVYDIKLKDNFYELDGKFYDLEKGRFVKRVSDTISTYNVYKKYSEYCTELDERVFKIKTKGNPIIISNKSYFYLYERCIKDEFIDFIKAQNVSEELKKKKIEEFEEAHEYLMKNDHYYSDKNT